MSHPSLTSRNLFITLILAAISLGSVSEISNAIRQSILLPLGHALGGEPNLKIGVFDIGHVIGSIIGGLVSLFTGIFVLWLLMRFFWRPIARFLHLENTPPET